MKKYPLFDASGVVPEELTSNENGLRYASECYNEYKKRDGKEKNDTAFLTSSDKESSSYSAEKVD